MKRAIEIAAILQELINNLDEYALAEDTSAIVARAKGILHHHYSGKPVDDPGPKRRGPLTPFPSEMIAKIREAKGSLRSVAKELNISHEVVRKYRQR